MGIRTKGFTYGAVAAASYGLNPLFTLPLYKAGMLVDSVLFYRYFFACLLLGIMMKIQGESFAIKKSEILSLAAMGLLFSSSSLFLFISYNYMDAGIASTILFVYPVLVALIMALFFHGFYEFKMKQFLMALALGMRPAKIYNGVDSAVEGLFLVDGSGDVLCYHRSNYQAFADFLYQNTRFEKGNVDKDKYGFLERENGVYYFKLNIKLGLIKR